MTTEELNDAFCSCNRCNLMQKCSSICFGSGENSIMLVVLKAQNVDGKITFLSINELRFLTKLLELFDIQLSQCVLTSLIKCADGNVSQIEPCLQFLRWQTKVLKPKKIICFGESVAKRLICPSFSIGSDHGQTKVKSGIEFVGTFGLSKAMADFEVREKMLGDLINIFQNGVQN